MHRFRRICVQLTKLLNRVSEDLGRDMGKFDLYIIKLLRQE